MTKKLIYQSKLLKYNLIGVLFFSKENFKQAIGYFERALLTSYQDLALTAQLMLNLASCHFKLGEFQKSYDVLVDTKFRFSHFGGF